MILSLLYAGDAIIAVAPACDQQVYGWRFWTEIYDPPIDTNLVIGRDTHTVHVEIADDLLVKRLLCGDLTGVEAADAVEQYLSELHA